MATFKSILEEALALKKKKDEKEEAPAVEETPEVTPDVTPEEEEETEEEVVPEEEEEVLPTDEEVPAEETETYTIQDQLKDLCFSILDAVEAEALASGDDNVDENESIDISTELIAKYADQFPEEVAQAMYDTLSEYFEMDVDEGQPAPEEEEEYVEEPEVPEDETAYEEDKTTEEEK